MNKYRYINDESYLIEALFQYKKQRTVYPWFIAVKVICVLGLVVLLAAAVDVIVEEQSYSPLVWISFFVLLFFVAALFAGPKFDYFFVKRRLKKSPFYGDETLLTLVDNGISVKTQKYQTSLSWSACTMAKRRPSGFLLFLGANNFYWLPDQALIAGDVSDVQRLFSVNIRAYHDATI
jgi:hypothetical protein